LQKIKCELCGSNDLKKSDGEYVCQYCGAKYTLEEARKLMVEISGTVKIDNSDKIANYETLAYRALDDKDYKKADEYYGKLLELDSQNWKYIYYKGLCEAQLGDYAALIKGCERSFNVIKEKSIIINDIEKVKFQMANDIFEIETKNRDAHMIKFANVIMSMEHSRNNVL
jgi:tetratricopeptide (TPR) repeat protein